MRSIHWNTEKCKGDVLHIETPLGIVNIRIGLTDSFGRKVESIEVIPSSYSGEPHVELDGYRNTRLVQHPTVIEEEK